MQDSFADAEAALASEDLARAVAAVEAYRATPRQPNERRAQLALSLALLFLRNDDINEAERWTLRALQGCYRSDALCTLGEIALNRGDFEAAVAWYEAAGAGPRAYLPSYRTSRLRTLKDFVRPYEIVREATGDTRRHMLLIQSARQTFLPQMMASLERAGLERWRGPRILFTDGWDAPDMNGFEPVRSSRPRGQAHTMLAAFVHAIGQGVDWLTILEDDIVFTVNGLDYIAAVERAPDLYMHSWYTGAICPWPSCTDAVLAAFPCSAFTRAQAVTYPVETLIEIVASPVATDWAEPHGGDVLVARAGGRRRYGLHFPSIVQHIGGAASLVGSSIDVVTSPTFPGEDFDALRLFDAKK